MAFDRFGLFGQVNRAQAPLAEEVSQRVPQRNDLTRHEPARTVFPPGVDGCGVRGARPILREGERFRGGSSCRLMCLVGNRFR